MLLTIISTFLTIFSVLSNTNPSCIYDCRLLMNSNAIGQQAYVMARCQLWVHPCVRPSIRALTFSLNMFFSENTYPILINFYRNVPALVLFRFLERILFL